MRSMAFAGTAFERKMDNLYFYLHTRALPLLPGMSDTPIEEMENGSEKLNNTCQIPLILKCAV